MIGSFQLCPNNLSRGDRPPEATRVYHSVSPLGYRPAGYGMNHIFIPRCDADWMSQRRLVLP